jgi:hypothetical protein
MSELGTEIQELPTHLALVAGRLVTIGPDASGDSFLLASYLFEVSLKTMAIALLCGLKDTSPENSYTVAYRLMRADGLGDWENAIQQMASQPTAGYLHPAFQPTFNWLTQKRKPPADDWFLAAISGVDEISYQLGAEHRSGAERARTMRDLLRALVFIRNKTKAHGAVGPEFFASANTPYQEAVCAVLRCPLFKCRWEHLSTRVGKNTVRGIALRGPVPQYMKDSECEGYSPTEPGIFVDLGRGLHPLPVSEFLRTGLECKTFWLPNGGFTDGGQAEFIDYATGKTEKRGAERYVLPPAPLPASHTQGLAELEIQSNVFGNLPPPPSAYVERPALQQELLERLLDKNHPIITLHGRGGIGKTSLALRVAHQLASADEPPFGCIVWFSARDVDLLSTGPKPVRAAVSDLRSVSRAFASLFETEPSEEGLARVLQTPDATGAGRLLIFDNFETFSDARQLQKFLDAHTYLPNKVLITSRERAFKADYPIEVRGMEAGEARTLLLLVGREFAVERLLTDEAIRSIYEYTDGHPYVMRLLVAEMEKERRYVSPKELLPRRTDIVSAVFERSFNKLSSDGKWAYLLTANWRSAIPELALVVICAEREVDAEAGAEECVRLSLLSTEMAPDGSYYYWAPELARVFARKKLDSDPDRLAIVEALSRLHGFGVLKPGQIAVVSRSVVVDRFLATVLEQTDPTDAQEVNRLDRALERIAELYPVAWRQLCAFRQRLGMPAEEIEYALRRWVEEQPFEKAAWLQRAQFAESTHDDATYISSLVSAVDADPTDVELVRDVANTLCRFLDAHKTEIPRTRRGVYLAGVRGHMEKLASKLDATGLSRLAWLYLLENNREKGLFYATLGLEKEPNNEHCERIVRRQRLEA